jgi:nucleoid-associated protein YgaU
MSFAYDMELQTDLHDLSSPDLSKPIQPPHQHSSINIAIPAVYRVRRGDKLETIVNRYYGSSENLPRIIAYNKKHIDNPNIILTGQLILLLPPRLYKVQEGDTGLQLARTLLGSSKRRNDIVELNKLPHPDKILAGEILVLPQK